jgi:hypothetical protein
VDEGGQEWSQESHPREDDAGRVDYQRAVKVLEDDLPTPAGNLERLYYFQQIISDQDDISALLSHICSGTHRDTNIGLGESWSIVNPVADHGYFPLELLKGLDVLELFLRQKLPDRVIQVKFMPNAPRRNGGVAGQQHGLDFHRFQVCYSLLRLTAKTIINEDCT